MRLYRASYDCEDDLETRRPYIKTENSSRSRDQSNVTGLFVATTPRLVLTLLCYILLNGCLLFDYYLTLDST